MDALADWWRKRSVSSVRQAWGMAPQAGDWALVGLSRHGQGLVKVHTTASFDGADGQADDQMLTLSQSLHDTGRARGGWRHRLHMALPFDQVLQGHVDVPSAWSENDWRYDIQLAVSEALQLDPNEVNFDFEPAPETDGQVRRVHWIACAAYWVQAFKNCTRAAGWRLASVEPQMQAAQRALSALVGGVASVLTLAPQDWQFEVDKLSANAIVTEDLSVLSGNASVVSDITVRPILDTPAGPRLVASGLALRAWQT